MEKSARCHACRKEVAETPRVCPHCGAPNPTLESAATRKIVAVLLVVIVAAIAVDLFHGRRATSTAAYTPGRTYLIAKRGIACLTLDALGRAAQLRPTAVEEVRQFGCLLLLPDKEWRVQVLDTSATALKVRVFAPDPSLNDFTGWTDPDTVSPEPAPQA